MRERILSLAMVLAIGFLLLVSLLVSAVLAGLTNAYHDYLPGSDVIAHVIVLLVLLVIASCLFAAIFKFLSDARVAWRDV